MKAGGPATWREWREMADQGSLGAWLARNKGTPAYLCLTLIATDLRASRTKAQRLELAEALERLATPVLNLERPYKSPRGRKDQFLTWRDAALVNALVKYHGAEKGDAVRAVVLMRSDKFAGGLWKAHDRIARYLRDVRAGKKLLNYSHHPAELARAASLLSLLSKGIHRIKK